MNDTPVMSLWIKIDGELIPIKGGWSVETISQHEPLYTRNPAIDGGVAGHAPAVVAIILIPHDDCSNNVAMLLKENA